MAKRTSKIAIEWRLAPAHWYSGMRTHDKQWTVDQQVSVETAVETARRLQTKQWDPGQFEYRIAPRDVPRLLGPTLRN